MSDEQTSQSASGQQPAPTGGDSAAGAETPDVVRNDPAFQEAMKSPPATRQHQDALARLTRAYHVQTGETVPEALQPRRPVHQGDQVERAAREAFGLDRAETQAETGTGTEPEGEPEIDWGEVDRMAHRLSTSAGGEPLFPGDPDTASAVSEVAVQAGFSEADVRRVAAEVGQQMTADTARQILARWLGSEAEADRAVQTAREALKAMPPDVRRFIEANENTIGNSPSVILTLARRKL